MSHPVNQAAYQANNPVDSQVCSLLLFQPVNQAFSRQLNRLFNHLISRRHCQLRSRRSSPQYNPLSSPQEIQPQNLHCNHQHNHQCNLVWCQVFSRQDGLLLYRLFNRRNFHHYNRLLNLRFNQFDDRAASHLRSQALDHLHSRLHFHPKSLLISPPVFRAWYHQCNLVCSHRRSQRSNHPNNHIHDHLANQPVLPVINHLLHLVRFLLSNHHISPQKILHNNLHIDQLRSLHRGLHRNPADFHLRRLAFNRLHGLHCTLRYNPPVNLLMHLLNNHHFNHRHNLPCNLARNQHVYHPTNHHSNLRCSHLVSQQSSPAVSPAVCRPCNQAYNLQCNRH